MALAAYRAVAERGELTMRVEGNLLWDRTRGDEQIDDLVELRANGSLGRLRIRGAKIFADGVLENFTGALLEPYVGTDNYGISMLDADELERVVVLLDSHDFQVHMHTIGDRAVRDALDALESAERANGRRDTRHHLAHLQLIHPDDLPRFAELGVIGNVSPYWACRSGYVEELTEPFIGPERSARMYPFGSLLRAGARLAFGSDWTVSTADPLPQLEVAVTRVSPDTRGLEPLLPEEGIDLPTALADLHPRLGLRELPRRRDGDAGGVEARRPRRPRPRHPRSRLGPDRRCARAPHPRRGRGRLRGSRRSAGSVRREVQARALLGAEPVGEERLHDPVDAALVAPRRSPS